MIENVDKPDPVETPEREIIIEKKLITVTVYDEPSNIK